MDGNSALLPAKFPSFPPHQEEEGWSRGAGRDQRRAPDRGRRGAKWGICLEEIGDLHRFTTILPGKIGDLPQFCPRNMDENGDHLQLRHHGDF